ncbi:MAG: hypothetical protein D6776_02435 [Planctomycetota bacterium]|nr:MAG: hypothetical protein D6776_02435 [Planctomycetota bacterium]
MAASLLAWVGRDVVLDLSAPLVVLGRLERVTPDGLLLRDADVHELLPGATTKERYVLEARKHGIRRNRALVWIRIEQLVGVSPLDDVVLY